jgi:hypothetical protein
LEIKDPLPGFDVNFAAAAEDGSSAVSALLPDHYLKIRMKYSGAFE